MAETPILDFLKNYSESGFSRLHMPGHKGQRFLGPEELDLTEIRGADELYAPEGIILKSEETAAELFGVRRTFYSTEGSSHMVRTMVFLAKQYYYGKQGRKRLLAARNCHKSFLYALGLCDLTAEWLYPDESSGNSISAGSITPEALKRKLTEMEREEKLPFAVYLTSPDYLGQVSDIREMARILKAYDIPLLVDNAHGAYLHFLPDPMHPMDLGAAMCCDSAHKTLPALTGAAYLHVNDPEVRDEDVLFQMEMTGTTSPSYLIMASLDRLNACLSEHYPEELERTIRNIDALKGQLWNCSVPVVDSEPLKLVIETTELGYTGTEFSDILREYRVEPEFSDLSYVVMMFTTFNRTCDYERILSACKAAKKAGRTPLSGVPKLSLRPLPVALSPREALFSAHETIPLSEASGRILGAPTVSCPPAIPIAVSGERLTEAILPVFSAYGIDKLIVVRE